MSLPLAGLEWTAKVCRNFLTLYARARARARRNPVNRFFVMKSLPLSQRCAEVASEGMRGIKFCLLKIKISSMTAEDPKAKIIMPALARNFKARDKSHARNHGRGTLENL